MSKFLCNVIAAFIPKKKNRKHFREKCANYNIYIYILWMLAKLKKFLFKEIHISFLIGPAGHTIDKWPTFNTLFQECCKDKKFKVSILRVSEEETETYNDFLANLDKKIKVYTYFKNNKELNLKLLNIDYLFVLNPYGHDKVDFNKWYKKIKICYIEYGCTFITENMNSERYLGYPIYKLAHKLFYENDFMFDNICKFNNISKEKLVVSGKPKYDYIFKKPENINNNLWKLDKSKNKNVKRILWTPHSTVRDVDPNTCGSHSKFLEYCDLWLKIPKMYPDLDIIMKPHPNLFHALEYCTNGEWDKNKIQKWKDNFLDNPNTQIIENGLYHDLFLTSDAIINDSISFIVEYLLTLKPFLLCRNGFGLDGYSKYGENIANSYYNAYKKEDIINFIEDVVLNEHDIMYEKRKKVLEENIFIPSNGAGNFIKEYIKKDYKKGDKMKIGYIAGVFDLLHVGHINALKISKENCDYLIVDVVSDEVCYSYKNKYPIIPQEQRMKMLKSLKYVDEVHLQDTVERMDNKLKNWEMFKFNIHFIGDEWKGTEKWNRYEKEFAEHNIEIMYIPYTQGISSTLIREKINKH